MSKRAEQQLYCFKCEATTSHHVMLLDNGDTEWECDFCGKIVFEPEEEPDYGV